MMKTFIYKLKDETGKALYGFLDASDKKELKRRLRQSTYYFISAVECDKNRIFKKRIDLDTLLMFTRRLASLIEAGIPILTAMHILWRQTEEQTLQLVISHIRRKLEEGKKISEALEDFSNIFPVMYRSMISVAEKAGGLVAILKKLTVYIDYQRQTIMRAKKATLYPVIVVIFAFLVLICMFTFVVPTFQSILIKLKIELPLLTRVVLWISKVLRSWQFIVTFFVLGGAIVFTYKNLRKNPKFSYYFDYFKFKIPILGYILYSISLSRFIHSLSILIGAGLPIIESFKVAKMTTSNQRLLIGIDEVQQKVEQGASLYESFKGAKIFPVLVTEMIGIGESAGTMVNSLNNLAAHFDEEIEYRQNKLFTLIEPFLIMVVGGIVIITLLAIYLPIFSIWKGLLR